MPADFTPSLLLWTAAGLAVHEAAHAVAALAGGMRVTEIHLGLGPLLARLGPVRLRAWPLGVGVEVPDPDLERARPVSRAVMHAAGPVANLILAALLRRHDWTGSFVNLALGVANLLPLPMQDGGWLASLIMFRGRYGDEAAWHRRMAGPVWATAGLAMLTAVVWSAMRTKGG